MSAVTAISPACQPATPSRRFPLLLIAYLGTLLVLRPFVSSTLQWDEAEQTIFSQALRWGYSEQPPLYTWLTWAAFQVFGPGVLGLAVVKTAVFAVLFGLTYRTAARTLGDARLAGYAAFSLLLIPYFAWEANRDRTHSVLLAAAVAGTVDATLLVVAAGRTRDYAALGVWLGVGVLSKYNAAFCDAAVLAATVTVPAARRRLRDRRIVLTAAIALVITTPHLAWLARHGATVWSRLETRAAVGVPAASRGLIDLFRESALLAGPLLLAVVSCLPAVVRRPATDDDARRWLGWYFVALAVGLLAAVAGGATRILSHWLAPLLVPLPVYLVLRARGHLVTGRGLRGYAAVLTLAAVSVLGVRASLHWGGRPGRRPWHAGRDLFYETAARHWAAAGLDRATIVTDDPNVGGNLRAYFPGLRVECTRYPGFEPPADEATGPRLAVWAVDPEKVPEPLAALLRPGVEVERTDVPPDLGDHRYHALRYAAVSGPRPRR